MACIREYYHHAIEWEPDGDERPSQEYDGDESEDGYEPSHNKYYDDEGENGDKPYPNGTYEDQDGQEWTYSIHMNYYNEPENCGSSDKQYWVESAVAEWLKEEEDSEDASCEEDKDDTVPTDESDSSYWSPEGGQNFLI